MTPDSGRALRAVDRGEFFPAIIKQFNWICSYAGELVVWISISMPSHKSYFQVHWALSSAKLILHDMPRGAWHGVFSMQRTPWQTPASMYQSHSSCIYTHTIYLWCTHTNKRLEHTQLLQNCYMKTKFADVVTPTPAGFGATSLLQHILNS